MIGVIGDLNQARTAMRACLYMVPVYPDVPVARDVFHLGFI